jgi:hypothetical protein
MAEETELRNGMERCREVIKKTTGVDMFQVEGINSSHEVLPEVGAASSALTSYPSRSPSPEIMHALAPSSSCQAPVPASKASQPSRRARAILLASRGKRYTLQSK